jgi:hypothetical protein
MELEQFIRESDEWMSSIGYSLFSSAANGAYRNYICDNGEYHAGVVTRLVHLEPRAEVCAVGEWQFIQISTSNLAFKHPNIQNFIDAVHDLVEASKESRLRIHHRNVLKRHKEADNG